MATPATGVTDQPMPMQSRVGQALWALLCPQEVNETPMVIARQMDGKDFARLVIDNFDEMQEHKQPIVMGLALRHIVAACDRGDIWIATPGAICQHVTA